MVPSRPGRQKRLCGFFSTDRSGLTAWITSSIICLGESHPSPLHIPSPACPHHRSAVKPRPRPVISNPANGGGEIASAGSHNVTRQRSALPSFFSLALNMGYAYHIHINHCLSTFIEWNERKMYFLEYR